MSYEPKKNALITLVICTYNRAELLRSVLEDLTKAQPIPNTDFEIIVVDNNSIDTTREIVSFFVPRLPLRYLFEPRQGKAYALNTAIEHAADAELILFTDDDVQLPPEWLTRFVTVARNNPDYGWYGAKVVPWWPSGQPSWWREESRPALAGYVIDYDLGTLSRPFMPGDRYPIGAAMAVRPVVFSTVGGYREDLGPRGNLRGVGEETDLIERAVRAGYRGFYVADAMCRHYVDPARMRLIEFVRFGIGKGLNQYRSVADKQHGSLFQAASQVTRGCWQLVKGRGDRFRICLINAGIEMGRRVAAREMGVHTKKGYFS